ncbi:MAG: T9SS type A sorting domain-containing protein [Bacteroidia bacterium]|nr:T9SS type A sorting domain-containing protein [Bacteroidia bacterium]
MKKITFFTVMLLLVFTSMNAQNVYVNDFNSLEINSTPADFFTSSITITATVQAADAVGNNGSKFLKMSPGGTSLNFRSPIITLELGKSYAFTAKTYVPEAKNRVILFAPAVTGAAYAQTAAINTPLQWIEHRINLTPTDQQLSVRVGFYSGQLNTVDLYADDMAVFEYVPDALQNTEAGDTKVVKNLLNGNFQIMSSLSVSAYEVFNTNGQLIKTEKGLNAQNINVSAGNFSKGVYIFKITDRNSLVHIQKVVK